MGGLDGIIDGLFLRNAIRFFSYLNFIWLLGLGFALFFHIRKLTPGNGVAVIGLFAGAGFFALHGWAFAPQPLWGSASFELIYTVLWILLLVLPAGWLFLAAWFSARSQRAENQAKNFGSWHQWAVVAADLVLVLLGIFFMDFFPYEQSQGRLTLPPSTVLLLGVFAFHCIWSTLWPIIWFRRAPPGSPAALPAVRAGLARTAGALGLVVLIAGVGTYFFVDPLGRLVYSWNSYPQAMAQLYMVDLICSLLILVGVNSLRPALITYEGFSGHFLPSRTISTSTKIYFGLAIFPAALMALTIDLTSSIISGLFGIILASVYFGQVRITDKVWRNALGILEGSGRSHGNLIDELKDSFARLAATILKSDWAWLYPGPTQRPNLPGGLEYYPAGKTLPTAWKSVLVSELPPNGPKATQGSREGFYYGASPSGEFHYYRLDLPHGYGALFFNGNQRPPGREDVLFIARFCEKLLDDLTKNALTRELVRLKKEQLQSETVLEYKARRILHDDILPALHTVVLEAARLDVNGLVEDLTLIHKQISALLQDIGAVSGPSVKKVEPWLDWLRRSIANHFDGQLTIHADVTDKDFEKRTDLELDVFFHALRELVRNAHRHARPSGPLDITVRLGHGPDGSWQAEVRDNGQAWLDGGPGTGLTLHGGLIRLLGGQLTLQQVHGLDKITGTVATVRIPEQSGRLVFHPIS